MTSFVTRRDVVHGMVQSWEETVLETLSRELPPHLFARLHTPWRRDSRAVFEEGGLLVHVSPFGLGGKGALLVDDIVELLPRLDPVAPGSLEMWIEPRSYSRAALDDIRYGRAPTAPRFAWAGTSLLDSLKRVLERGMKPADGSEVSPGFGIYLLAPEAGADYLSFTRFQPQSWFVRSATGFCVQNSDGGAPIGRAAIEISRDGKRASLRYCTIPPDDLKEQFAAARLGSGYSGFAEYWERGALPAIKQVLKEHPETLAVLPLEGVAMPAARVLDTGEGFLVHITPRQIDGNGLDMLPNLDLPNGSTVPCVEPRTLTHADLKALLYGGPHALEPCGVFGRLWASTRHLWASTHIRDGLRRTLEKAKMPFPRAYSIVAIDASHPAFPSFNCVPWCCGARAEDTPVGAFANSLRGISLRDEISGLVVLEVTAPSAGQTRALLRRHSAGVCHAARATTAA